MSRIASVICSLLTRFSYWRWERRITKVLMKDISESSSIALSILLGSEPGLLTGAEINKELEE